MNTRELSAFVYQDLGDGKYSIQGLKDKFAEQAKIPEGVVEIEKSAFSDCCMLRSVTFPTTLLAIREYAFYNCSALEEIILPDSLKVIGQSTFASCSSLKKIVFPANLAEIPRNLFKGDFSLKAIALPEGLQKICQFAFADTGINEIHVPKSVQLIEGFAFGASIKKVYYAGSATEWREIYKKTSVSQKFTLSCAKNDDKASSAKKEKSSSPKTKARATSNLTQQEDLVEHIKVCETAIKEQNQALEQTREEKRKGGFKFTRVFVIVVIPLLLGIVFLMLKDSNDTLDILSTICLVWSGGFAVLLGLTSVLSRDFRNKKTAEANSKIQDIQDSLEWLREMLRVAKSEKKICYAPDESNKFFLSYYQEAEKRCENCIYLGETVLQRVGEKSGIVYSQKHVKYFCNKHSDVEVLAHNCCDEHCFVRVAKACEQAKIAYEQAKITCEQLKKQAAAGFR